MVFIHATARVYIIATPKTVLIPAPFIRRHTGLRGILYSPSFTLLWSIYTYIYIRVRVCIAYAGIVKRPRHYGFRLRSDDATRRKSENLHAGHYDRRAVVIAAFKRDGTARVVSSFRDRRNRTIRRDTRTPSADRVSSTAFPSQRHNRHHACGVVTLVVVLGGVRRRFHWFLLTPRSHVKKSSSTHRVFFMLSILYDAQ